VCRGKRGTSVEVPDILRGYEGVAAKAFIASKETWGRRQSPYWETKGSRRGKKL